ncbi:MAG: hypothetical protein ACOZF0_03115 [Thermodesulfobacteriota bacterium]
MMRILAWIMGLLLWIGTLRAGAEEKTDRQPDDISREDLEIIRVMETLELMEIADQMELLNDMEIVIDEERKENDEE